MRFHHHLARFLFGFSHADHPLTGVQRVAYDAKVRALSSRDRWGQAMSIIPGFAAVTAIPVWARLQNRVAFPWQLAAQLIFAACVAAYVIWLMRWKNLRHGPRALRELGLADVCARCAYDLSRSPEPEGRCPECGEAFSRFRPDKTGSTDQP